MKKLLLLYSFFSSLFISRALADSIPNAGFESWWFGGWDPYPAYWTVNNSQIMAANVVPDSTSHSGYLAMKLINSGNLRPFASCGFSLTHHPLAMTGFMKNQLHLNDTATIRVRVFANGLLVDSAYQEVTGGMVGNNYFSIHIAITQHAYSADSCEIIFQGGIAYQSQISFDDLSLTFPTGINEQELNSTIRMFPNPCQDQIVIKFEKAYSPDLKMMLRDLSGREVRVEMQGKTGIGYVIHTESLLTGVYLLSVSDNKNKITQRIVKQ